LKFHKNKSEFLHISVSVKLFNVQRSTDTCCVQSAKEFGCYTIMCVVIPVIYLK
jgi:hypothetical protein